MIGRRNLIREIVTCIGLAFLFSVPAHAQTPAPPTAPLPTALSTATKLFIGNAGDQENADCLRVYNDFYNDINALGRYQLVADPSAADLVLELHYEIALGQSLASHQGGDAVRQFRVVIENPHTRIILWSLTERTNYALFQKNRDKNLDETVAKLATDFSLLGSAQAPNNKSLVKH